MFNCRKLAVVLTALTLTGAAFAQSDDDELKIAALEALIAAPPERALPLATKALRGNNSDEVKEAALFVLGQIDMPEAHNILIEVAQQGGGEVRLEAIRMIGISGHRDSLAKLRSVFDGGDGEVQEAVLEAYLIADDAQSVYDIALNTDNEEIYEKALETLGAMDAHEQLRQLRETKGVSEGLIEAYMIADDVDSLREIALDSSDPELQAEAIEMLGVVGGSGIEATLVDIYKSADSKKIREAALEGMLIGDFDDAVLQLYRDSNDAAEKRDLLQYLVMMDSEAIYDVINQALDGGL